MPGALITLTSADGLYAESVYSNHDGHYKLETLQYGRLTIRFRKPGFKDEERELDLHEERNHTINVGLAGLKGRTEISEALPASTQFTRIKFESEKEKQWFQVDCLTCHQIGNRFTRARRTEQQWRQIVTRMLGFYGEASEAMITKYANVLLKAFDGTPIKRKLKYHVSPEVFTARIKQWKLPMGIIAHDMEYRRSDGKFYTFDQANDYIYITDPILNRTVSIRMPDDNIPVGGKFFTLYNNRNPLGMAARHGPHAVQEGPDRKLYSADSISGRIGVFDPETKVFQGFDIGGDAMYPHTLRFDKKNRLWFTLSVSNQVGYFDTNNHAMQLVTLTGDTDRNDMKALIPYGLDINPVDGSVWYSSLMANKIGRIDPDTLKVEVFSPPLVGPRRFRFAADGTLWIPGFGTGTLVKLDTATMKYTSYKLPVLSEHEVEAPYAVGVHPQTQDVWITANMSDRMFRFIPAEERFVEYLLPTRGIYLRDVVFTPEGAVCSPSSPMPVPVVVEGGMQEVICIEPVTGQ